MVSSGLSVSEAGRGWTHLGWSSWCYLLVVLPPAQSAELSGVLRSRLTYVVQGGRDRRVVEVAQGLYSSLSILSALFCVCGF